MSLTASGITTVRLHRLTMVPEDDGVMVGRPDVGSYALFPPEGAEALRRLGADVPMTEVVAWYERTCGTTLDVKDFLETLEDLQFIRADGEECPAVKEVRWRRLGRWTFSWPAWVCYATLIVAAVIAMIARPWLRPSYANLFFTQYLVVISVTLTFVQVPCILIHEGFHALSGRRLGLPSTLRFGRRLYFLVAETRLDSLLSVPRRKRYLPFLCGMLADAVLVGGFTLLALGLRNLHTPHWTFMLCLAIAFATLLRLVWQFMFYLETDLYYVIATALRCSDLQNATRFLVKTKIRKLLRRRPPTTDLEWTERDQRMARWYAPVFLAGYAFSLGSLVWAGIPTTVRFWTTVVGRIRAAHAPTEGLIDAIVFAVLTLGQFGLLGYVAVRDRRRARKNLRQGG